MITSIKFINKEQTVIKVFPYGRLIKYPLVKPDSSIAQWLEGGNDDWDKQNKDYLNYESIITYEDRLQEAIAFEEECGFKSEVSLKDRSCDNYPQPWPQRPQGYYTQDQVDVSLISHDFWTREKQKWDSDIDTSGEYSIKEPVIRLRPEDLTPVFESAPLISNTIQPYVESVQSIRSKKLSEIDTAFLKEANTDVISEGETWAGGIDNARSMKDVSNFSGFRSIPKGIVHSKNNAPIEMLVKNIEVVAADIWDQYHNAHINYMTKLKELTECSDDKTCIGKITW